MSRGKFKFNIDLRKSRRDKERDRKHSNKSAPKSAGWFASRRRTAHKPVRIREYGTKGYKFYCTNEKIKRRLQGSTAMIRTRR